MFCVKVERPPQTEAAAKRAKAGRNTNGILEIGQYTGEAALRRAV